MKKTLFLSVMMLGMFLAGADSQDIYKFELRKNVPFLEEGRMERLDLYLPQGTEGARPAVIMIHGGSWRGGSKSSPREINICENLAKMGFVAASIEYRLTKENTPAWPVNLQDCKNAVKFLRAKAETFQIAKDKIGVIGASAGGHLAVLLALTAKNSPFEPNAPYPDISSEVACCINMYGPMLMSEKRKNSKSSFYKMLGVGSYEEHKEQWNQAIPMNYIAPGVCPFLSVQGLADTLVPPVNASTFHAALQKQGCTSELLEIPDVAHQFSMEYTKDKKRLPPIVRQTMLRFLEIHLKGFTPEQAEAHYKALLTNQ